MLCGGTGVKDVTDVTDIMDLTDIMDVLDIMNIPDIMDVMDITGRCGSYRHYGRTPFGCVKVDTDRISPTFVFVWDLVLIGENQHRSSLNPVIFFVCDHLLSQTEDTCEFDLS